MSCERKSIWEKIKNFFSNIFKKEKIEALPEPEEQPKIKMKSKEEFLELYKKIKEDQVDIKTLSREDLIMFIKLGTEELKFLDKRIESEKTECNMYQKEIEFYQRKLGETA